MASRLSEGGIREWPGYLCWSKPNDGSITRRVYVFQQQRSSTEMKVHGRRVERVNKRTRPHFCANSSIPSYTARTYPQAYRESALFGHKRNNGCQRWEIIAVSFISRYEPRFLPTNSRISILPVSLRKYFSRNIYILISFSSFDFFLFL